MRKYGSEGHWRLGDADSIVCRDLCVEDVLWGYVVSVFVKEPSCKYLFEILSSYSHVLRASQHVM
jgi:hypothetical protein